MSLPKQIVQMRPARGVNVDLPPSEVSDEEVTFTRNIHFRNGLPSRTIGETQRYGTLLSNLRNIINVEANSGTNFWVYTGEDSISSVQAMTHTDITPAGGLTSRDDPNTYTTSLLNGILCWNNGDDPPQFWDGVAANPMTELPGWIAGDRCEALRPFKNHLFALAMTESVGGSLPMKLKWSTAAAAGQIPGSWTPDITNEAGDTQLADTPGQIVDGLQLRSSFVIYKEGSTYLADFIGGQFVFSFRKLFVTSGILSRNCVTEYNGKHYALTDDDIIVHDGHTITSLLNKRARKAVFGGLDQSNFQSSFVINYEQQQEIWFCLPSAGNFYCDTVLIYNLVDDAWSQRDLVECAHGASGRVTDEVQDNTWDADSQAWDLDTTNWNAQQSSGSQRDMMLASTDEATPLASRLLEVDTGSDFDGVPINATIQKTSMHFGEPEKLKLIRRVWPKVQANAGTAIDIRIGSQMAIEDPIEWSASQSFIQGTTRHIDTFTQGRYLSFEASTVGGVQWQMSGFDLEMELRGYF